MRLTPHYNGTMFSEFFIAYRCGKINFACECQGKLELKNIFELDLKK